MASTTTHPLAPAARLATELEKLDPEVPFRASQTHIHHTWARTYHSRPELYLRPQSLPEIQKIVTLARRMRRRLVVVGCGHSPSDMTCTSAWMLNLDNFADLIKVDKERKTLTVQAGTRLRDLNSKAGEHGLTMPSLGSINDQSIAGAIATATHGSSMFHGLLSDNVKSLRILLANGQAVKCSESQSPDLFRAALVSLGGLGIIVEVEYQMVEARRIEWLQTIVPHTDIYSKWNEDLWTQNEFVRVWWLPYTKRAIVWRADKTTKPIHIPKDGFYGGKVGYHTYHILLWISQYFPRILPTIEWFIFGMQYGFKDYANKKGVEEQRTGLLMNCLYSQFVNEWSIPLSRGPEALIRLTAWINGDEKTSGIPFTSKGVWVHSPIEVRVANTVSRQPRPFLDTSCATEPTLYLNATLYRPYGQDPPCHERYYQAFEYLMKELGGRPHWAKNFSHSINHDFLSSVYGDDLSSWLAIRDQVDPDGMFIGSWHRRTILPPKSEYPVLPLEEKEIMTRKRRAGGGVDWIGEQARWWDGGVDVFGKRVHTARSESEESFDLMAGAEVEASVLLESVRLGDGEDEEEEEMGVEKRFRGVGDEGPADFGKM